MNYSIHSDGGARGNPGPAAIGFTIETCECQEIPCKETKRQFVYEHGEYIGETTNNVAEYQALERALTYLLDAQRKGSVNPFRIVCYLDSNLVVQQVNGLFKVKNSNLRAYLMKIRTLENELSVSVVYEYIPREQNQRADFLVNRALDEHFFL